MEEVRRLYNPKNNTITEVAISCPGVTPEHDNNPGFKTVSFNPKSKELMNYTTYHTVPSASTWGNASYTFNDIYKYSDKKSLYDNLSSDALASVHKKMDSIFTVINGFPSYNTKPGIEVKAEK